MRRDVNDSAIASALLAGKPRLREFAFGLAFACLLATVAAPAVALADQPVNFPDSHLNAAMRKALNIRGKAPIYESELTTLASLDLGRHGIADLRGLEYARNLTQLDLGENRIVSISPLSGLTNLTRLNLDDNRIADLGPVSELATLTTLSACRNSVSDLTPVSGLKNLTSLELDRNHISDLGAVAALTNLTRLDLCANRISDVAPAAGLTNLTSLDLSRNEITSITVLGALGPLTADVSHNWLDVSDGSGTTEVVDAWQGKGASITYLPQGHTTVCVLTTTPETIDYAAKTVVAGTLIDVDAGECVAGRGTTLQSSTDGVIFRDTAAVCTTTPGGTFEFTVAPTTKTYYRASFVGEGRYRLASTSAAVWFVPRVEISAPTAPSAALSSKAFTSCACLKPRHPVGSHPVRLRCYHMERRSGSYRWVLRKSVSAKAVNYSTYTKVVAAIALSYTGRWRINAYHAADSLNAATTSGYTYVGVKDRRIEQAIRWAKAHLGSHAWDHYCLRFANECYASGAGASVRRYGTAKEAADALGAAGHPSTNAPRGMYVFYDSMHGSTDLGHVGISLGNGTMISDNGGEGVCIKPINYGLRYIGWAAPPISPRIE